MSEIRVLCCTECDTPLVTTEGRGSYCLHCDYPPSMQDTYFVRVDSDKTRGTPELQDVAAILKRCSARKGE
jgi:RNase P subunit RPR2